MIISSTNISPRKYLKHDQRVARSAPVERVDRTTRLATSNNTLSLIPNTFQLVVHGQHQHRPLLDPYLRTSPSSKLLHSHDRVCRTEWNLLKASHDDELEIRWVRRVCEDLSSTLSHSTALQFISGLIEIFNSARLQGLSALTMCKGSVDSLLHAQARTLTSKSSSRLSVDKIRSRVNVFQKHRP
jgi:hypothetical protein